MFGQNVWLGFFSAFNLQTFKDTHRENTPSNKTKALAKGINMWIWEIRTLNQLFVRGSYTGIKFFKNLST